LSLSGTADGNRPAQSHSNPALRGRWKWAAGIIAVACLAQSIMWARWWEDPTHFKMSILFVWPAALFALAIWWIFYSGWSRIVRWGSIAAIAALVVAFFIVYRLEWDGDMVPRRIVLRSKPTAEQIARQFLTSQAAIKSPTGTQATGELETGSSRLIVAEGDWSGFRGPKRDGVVLRGSLRRNWDIAPPREIWRHPVGRGWSSFAVVGNVAFTQEQRDENESVVAYDVNNGVQLWVHQDLTVLSIVEANGGSGPHATPQFDEGLLYTLGGTGVLNCLEALSGKLVWSTNILQDAGDGKVPEKNLEWGMSGSPLIVDNLVIVIPGGTAVEGGVAYDKGVAAYDKISGDLIWAAGKHPASYASPRVETIARTRQLLIPNADGLSGHAIKDGKELWFFPLGNNLKVNSSLPWLLDDHSLLFGTGYGVGTARVDIEVMDGKWSASQRWLSNRFRPKFNDFVVRDGFSYGLDDGTLTCLDAERGTIRWKSGRYGYGQLLLVNGLLLIISEDGELVLIEAAPEKPDRLATFKALDSGFCWNHMALVRGRLLVRNANEAVCFDVSDDSGEGPAIASP
jgi:outer membrane protein assembly factor BamB